MAEKVELNVSDLLYMYDVQGMTMREIAQRLDVSTPTVCKYLKGLTTRKRTRKVRAAAPEPEVDAFAAVRNMPEVPEKKQESAVREQEKAIPEPESTPIPKLHTAIGGMNVVSHMVSIKGDLCTYKVDLTGGTVELCDGLIEGVLDAQGVWNLCRELMRIHTAMEASA